MIKIHFFSIKSTKTGESKQRIGKEEGKS